MLLGKARLSHDLTDISATAHVLLRTSVAFQATSRTGGSMTTRRVLAIAAIYILATVAWGTLGASILARTGEFDYRLGSEVAQLWGGQHRQVAPAVWVERWREVTEKEPVAVSDGKQIYREVKKNVLDSDPVRLAQSRVKVDLRLTHR
jgi:hypothetical protein